MVEEYSSNVGTSINIKKRKSMIVTHEPGNFSKGSLITYGSTDRRQKRKKGKESTVTAQYKAVDATTCLNKSIHRYCSH